MYTFIALYSTTNAYSVHLNFKPIKLSSVKAKNGLSHNNVNALTKDDYGFLWIGTDDGLNRYDGNNIEVFNHNTPKGLTFNSVRFLIKDPYNNKIWVGTNGSLEYYDYDLDSFIRETILPEKNIIEDVRKVIWNASNNKIVAIFNQGVYVQENNKYQLLSEERSEINTIERINNILFIGTEYGLFSYDLETRKKIRQILSKKKIRTLESFNDTLFIGTSEGNLYTLHNEDLKNIINVSHSIKTITKDENNNIWVGTESYGALLLQKDNNSFNTFRLLNQKITSRTINYIFSDKKGTIWLGSFGNGLLKYNQKDPFFMLAEDQKYGVGLSNNSVTCMIADDSKNIWVGTDGGGLNYVNLKTGSVERRMTGYNILSVAKKDNILFVGTYKNGMYYSKDNISFKKIKSTDQLGNKIYYENVWDILVENDSMIWMATTNGVLKYNPINNKIHRYKFDINNKNSLSNNDSRKIYKDIKGDIWIGTFHGLNRYRKETDDFKRLYFSGSKSNGININNAILSICEDENLNLWVGTFGKGLWLFNRQGDFFEKVNINTQLPNLVIYAIEYSSDHTLWLSSNNGITAFNTKTNKVINYNEEDGLQGAQFNVGSSSKISGHLLAFGGTNGINIFNPAEALKVHKQKLKPLIKGIIINTPNEEIQRINIINDKSTTLSPKNRNFAFDFSVIDYHYTHKIEYQTRIIGFDEHWKTTNTTSPTLYSNFQHGKYIFQVRARYLNEDWGEIESFKIELLPYIWETNIFKIVLFASFLISIFLLYKWYSYRLHIHHIKIDSIIKNRSQELLSKELLMIDIENQKSKIIKETLSKREKELTTHALRLVHLNSLIEQLDEKLLYLQKNPSEFTPSKINSIRRDIKNAENLEKEWEILNDLFAEVHQPFINTLQKEHPSLTDGNLRLCYLIRLNMNTKDIAAIMGISLNSVKVARKRLRKRMQLATEITLNDYILALGITH